MMNSKYDFIVVGAGAAGCVVGSRLANAASKPSVLLLEAGGPNDTTLHLAASERSTTAVGSNLDLDWGYKTEPQLGRQRLDYSLGKGIGGSTAIGFGAFLVGPREDWDGWARLLRDESFSWANARKHLDKIENLDPTIPAPDLSKFVNAGTGLHSQAGVVDLSYGETWRPDLEDVFLAAEQIGLPINPDLNSGDPTGLGMGALTVRNGLRVSSASAYLKDPPTNLKMMTDCRVARLLFEGSIAVGVEDIKGRHFFARKEVILSAGAINTPQLLMLSGIGPRDELQRHGIEVLQHLPQVGMNLQDHPYTSITVALKRSQSTPPGNPPQAPTPVAFLKSETALSSPEFHNLPPATQAFLKADTIPSMQLIAFTPLERHIPKLASDIFLLGLRSLLMNCQSRGSMQLRSTNPREPPMIDPRFLTHPYDRRAHVDGVRLAMRLLSAPIYANRFVDFLGPADDSDEAIWAWIQNNIHSSWHPACTARMGYSKGNACVDKDFRVFGVEQLRVVDLSVCVFVPSAHTQSTAYIVGEIAAEKLNVEHKL